MPNANTIARLVGAASPAQGSLAIPQVAPSGTSAAIVNNQLGNPAVLSFNASGPAAPTTGGAGLDGFAFKIRLVGKATTTQSCNITAAIQLALSPSTTVSSSNNIAIFSTKALNTASGNFFLEANCVWDSISTKLSGYQTGVAVDQTLVAVAALTNNVTAAGVSALAFVPVLTASATAGTVISIDEFSAEVL